MRKLPKRWIATLAIAGFVALGPWLLWVTLNHHPRFYSEWESVPEDVLKVEAKRFTASSLQLRNDIVNEPSWEAAFTDKEVNAWLTENLIRHFADELPPEISDPRVEFDRDRVTLAFKYSRGALTSIIWVVAKIDIPENNTVAVTIEKLRAGVVPIAAQDVLDQLTKHAIEHGVHVTWDDDHGSPRAIIRYRTSLERNDVALKQVQLEKGRIRISGASSPAQAAFTPPTLPNREVLQTAFPKRPLQRDAELPPPAESEATPEPEPEPVSSPAPAPVPAIESQGRTDNSSFPETRSPSN